MIGQFGEDFIWTIVLKYYVDDLLLGVSYIVVASGKCAQ